MSLKANTLWNLAGTLGPLALGAVTIPYILENVGVEVFGILTLVWALIGYFSLFDFGLGRALTQQIAIRRGAGLTEQVPSIVKTGLMFTAGIGMAGGALLAIAASPLGSAWLNVSPSLQNSTVEALLIASLGIPITTVTTGLRGVLEAYESFAKVNVLRMFLGVANFVMPAISVMLFGSALDMMVASLISARLIVLGAHALPVAKLMPIATRPFELRKSDIQDLLSFGAWMTVSNIASPLMVTADRFIISAMLGATVVAYYTVPFEVLIRVLIIPGALTGALFPRLAFLMTTNMREARTLYVRCIKLVAAVLIPVCLLLAAGSYWGLTVWLGRDFAEKSWQVASLLAVGIICNGIAQIPHAAIQAAGNVRATAIIHVAEMGFYVPILVISVQHFGLHGAAVAWVGRVGFDLAILLTMATKAMRRVA